MKKSLPYFAASALLVFFAGCGAKVTQQQLLDGIGKDIITPLYEEAATEASSMAGAAEAYQKNPTPENLQTLDDAWKKAAIAWQRTEPYRFGPATDLWLSNKIGYQNIRSATIDGNVAKISTPDEVKLSAVGASGKGLFAIEYLLFKSGGVAKTPSEKESRYLTLAALDAAALTKQLAEAWNPSGKNYTKTFADGGQANLDKMVNGMIESIERLKEKRIARLLGREAVWQEDSDSQAKTDPSMAGDGTVLAAPLEGVDRLFSTPSSNPDKTVLILAYLEQTGSSIGPEYTKQNLHCIELTKALPAPLNSVATRPALEADYLEIKKLVALSKSSLISALGVTLTFNSNDGD